MILDRFFGNIDDLEEPKGEEHVGFAAKLPTVSPDDAIQWLDDWSDFFVTSLAEDATKAVKTRLLTGLRNGSGVQNVMKEVSNALAPYAGDPEEVQDPEVLSPARLETIVRTNNTSAFNQGRLVAAREAGDLLVAMRYDAVLDTRTTEVCSHLDGLYFRPDSPELDTLAPPNHYQCRSILSPIVVGDPEADEVEFITPEEVGRAKALAGEGFGGEYVQHYDFNPDQARDEEGQWTDGGGGRAVTVEGTGLERPGIINRLVASEARRHGYPEEKVKVLDDDPPVIVVGDREFKMGGRAFTQGDRKGEIEIFSKNVSPEWVDHIVAHEVMHQRFERVLESYNAERERLFKDPRTHGPSERPGVIWSNDTLDPAYVTEYPYWSQLRGTHGQRGNPDLLDTVNLANDDGVTTYSQAYWEGFSSQRVDSKSAVHETLAEIHAVETRRAGSLKKPLTQFTKPPSQRWMKLYRTVNKLYEEHHAGKD